MRLPVLELPVAFRTPRRAFFFVAVGGTFATALLLLGWPDPASADSDVTSAHEVAGRVAPESAPLPAEANARLRAAHQEAKRRLKGLRDRLAELGEPRETLDRLDAKISEIDAAERKVP